MLILLIVIISGTLSSNNTTKNLLNDKVFNNLKEKEEMCKLVPSSCKIKICLDKDTCTEKEIEESKIYLALIEDCENTPKDEQKSYCQGILYEKITNNVNSNVKGNSNYLNGGGNINADLNIKTIGDNSNLIEDFAQKYSIESRKLKAFLKVESNANPFDGDHPTVRFECLKFNIKVENENQVSCKTDKYKYGNAEDTNKEAFLRALKIDERNAILSSSFGMGQIMGFNYYYAGYETPEDFYQAMFDEEEQIKAFLNFIKKNNIILAELKKTNTDWDKVSEQYNGKGYGENNYAQKIEKAANSFA